MDQNQSVATIERHRVEAEAKHMEGTLMNSSITAAFCNRVADCGLDTLTPEIRDHARTLILDGLAVALAGTVQEAPPGIIAETVREQGAKPVASVIGFDFLTSPAQAAYVNGTSMHVLDYEPMWMPANHALSTTLPAALAMAEATGANGEALAIALIKGVETQGCIREASAQWDPGELKFHPPGLVGPMSSAVAAGSLLNLEPQQMSHALGIAASRCGSVLANAGTMTKSTHCGLAASLGLEAAVLASRGFDANPAIFDDPRGYVAAFFPEFAPEALLEFGPPYRVLSPSYSIKMFPSQFGTHFSITVGLDIHAQLKQAKRSVSDIVRVVITAPAMPYVDRPAPDTGLAGKFSWQYTFATAVLDGQVTMETFEDQRRFSRDVISLLECIEVASDDTISGRFDTMHVEAEVSLSSGETLRARTEGPPGSWRGTPLQPGAHLAKVKDCLDATLDPLARNAVIELTSHIDSLDKDGLRQLMRHIRKPKKQREGG